MTVAPLPTSTPSAEGVAPGGIGELLDALEELPGVEPHSLMILRHGRVVAAGWWRPYTAGRAHLLYSLSKSFTSTAAGFAAGEGLIRLDDPVLSYFPELDAEVTDTRCRAMLVRHVASMATGHVEDTWQQVSASHPEEPVRGLLTLPPERDPGTVFAYNQSATYALAAIVQRVTGRSLLAYLRAHLGDALGGGPASWTRDGTGRQIGFSGLHATTDTIARLGELYLRGGTFAGRRLLSAAWVEEATRKHIDNRPLGNPDPPPGPDWQQGYGFQFWMSRHGYRGDGAFGQYCVVLPGHDAVVAMTGQSSDMQAVLDACWRTLLPAFGAGGTGDEKGDARLAERLAALALAVPERAESASSPERFDGAALRPGDAGSGEQPSLLGARLARRAGAWELTLEEDGLRLALPVGRDWAVTETPSGGASLATASCGGWVDPETLEADVVFLETPHRLVVTCEPAAGTFTARWRTAPLHLGSLATLRAPGEPPAGQAG